MFHNKQEQELWKLCVSSEQALVCAILHMCVCVCVCVTGWEKSERTRAKAENQSDKLDRLRAQPDSERKHYIYWYCCSLPSRDRQSVITVSTWAASRLYTSAPGALHLGQEALRSFPSCSRAAWSKQIIAHRPEGTWDLEFCQILLH